MPISKPFFRLPQSTDVEKSSSADAARDLIEFVENG